MPQIFAWVLVVAQFLEAGGQSTTDSKGERGQKPSPHPNPRAPIPTLTLTLTSPQPQPPTTQGETSEMPAFVYGIVFGELLI